jgi:hypothetical protein
MFRLLAATLALAVASHSPALADDKERDEPKPNTLTPKEVEEGWILLFDGESTFGWDLHPESGGELTAKGGALIVRGGAEKSSLAEYGPVPWYFELRAEVEVEGSAGINVAFRGHKDTYKLVPPKGATGFRLVYAPQGDENFKLIHHLLWTDKAGKVIASERMIGQGCGLYHGPSLGLRADQNTRIALRNVKLRPLGTKPLFNGKDLDGWKVNGADPKRVASKWSVTPAGELAVKNGPGDLVSDKQFDNFVLQFECKTNGKALNSGVFFRCIPGQYQNGYEAQIQNAYKDNDRTKPADFGTGAIYRRVPARKVVSNDNEWFTMTVVADGKHVSTWVNGYQTVDWTDDRKEDENPRKGYRAAKGPLSIQGHDPTTDILFRNIRVAELPAK